MRTRIRTSARFAVATVALALITAACGDDSTASKTTAGGQPAPGASSGPAVAGAGIKLAVNPWTGSAVNANVAKVVMEAQLGTPVELVAVEENSAWVGLDAGDLDANLEIWPSGHVTDHKTYVEEKKSVVDLGKLGPAAKIGWYVPKFVVDEHPELKTVEGFKDPKLAKLFATAETGDVGQFLMSDPSFVTYDEQIIKNLNLPLKYTVAGSEAALLTAIDQSIADHKPLLMQFWKPHWKHLSTELVEVKLPDVTPECLASAASNPPDGKYACDYILDEIYKAANAGLEKKNKAAFDFISKFSLTTDQQSEIAGYIDRDGMAADAAAKKWVDANPDVVKGWLG
jgi:glycine betaine/proline transport system substrate-binding protein